jgi:hypothetical protein
VVKLKNKAPKATVPLLIEEEGIGAPKHLLIIADLVHTARIDVNLVCVTLPEHVIAEAEVTVAPQTSDPDEHCHPEPPHPRH